MRQGLTTHRINSTALEDVLLAGLPMRPRETALVRMKQGRLRLVELLRDYDAVCRTAQEADTLEAIQLALSTLEHIVRRGIALEQEARASAIEWARPEGSGCCFLHDKD